MALSCGEVRVLRGKTAFASAAPVAVEYDGDPHGELPVAVSLAPRPLRLMEPFPAGNLEVQVATGKF